MTRPMIFARAGRRAVVLAVAGVFVLSAACGGEKKAAPPGASAGTGTSPSAAEATAAGEAVSRAATAATVVRGAAVAADPCRILTREELEAALGFPLGPGQPGVDPIGAAQCAYFVQFARAETNLPNVHVRIYRGGPSLSPATYDFMREDSRGTDVPGLGDKAFVYVGTGILDTRDLVVLRKDTLFMIAVSTEANPNNPARGLSEDEKRTRLIAAARTALGRLS